MMSDWIALCSAAGFNVKKMKPLEVFMVAGKILNDATVSHENRVASLHAMTPQERLAVRERASGVVPFRKPTQETPKFFGEAANVVPDVDPEDLV
jgi:hypothetical protein